MRLNPKSYDACYFYGRCKFAQGLTAEAAVLFRKASELDPADYQSLNHLEMCLRSLGRHEESLAVCRLSLERTERHIALHPEDARALYLGANALLQLGDRERCVAWAERALAMDPEENTTLYNVACMHAMLGHSDTALALLEKTIRNGFGNREWMENDPDLSSLKKDPRFDSLLQLLTAKRSS